MKKSTLFRANFMWRLLSVIILFLFVSSCNNPPTNEQQPNKIISKKRIIKKPGSSFRDTIIIENKAAAFYDADSSQMEKIKAVNEKPVFDMLEHDCYYQMQNARKSLKENWPQIKIVEISKARYVLFIKEDKSKVCIDLNEKNDICGIFLFDGKKNPVLIDMPNVDTDLVNYFR